MTDHRRERGRRPDHEAGAFEHAGRPAQPDKRPPWRRRQASQPWPETSCSCDACKEACLNSPGWFLPGEVERLADYLNLTLEALFRKFLAIGTTHMPDGSRRHGVMPHKLRDHKKPGALWTLAELAEPGRCIFYDHGKCSIYPVRPFECSRMIHSHRKETKQLRQFIVEQWTRGPLQIYEAWVGRRLFPKHVPAGAHDGPPQSRRALWRPRGGPRSAPRHDAPPMEEDVELGRAVPAVAERPREGRRPPRRPPSRGGQRGRSGPRNP